MGLITIFSGWQRPVEGQLGRDGGRGFIGTGLWGVGWGDQNGPPGRGSTKRSQQEAALKLDDDALAFALVHCFGARIVGVDPSKTVVIEIPKPNCNAEFEEILERLGIRRFRLMYRDYPL